MPLHHSRRTFLIGGAAALAWGQTQTPDCALTVEQEEGPYYIDEHAVRRDITEGKAGLPLQLRVVLLDAKTCRPLENAAVDIWHCDALGVYSGFTKINPDGPPGGPPGHGGFGPAMFDSSGPRPPMPPQPEHRHLDATRFLRGIQGSDKMGRVEFRTLYPGWYSGRAIHIHLKVHPDFKAGETANIGSHVCHTGQLFFPEETTASVAKLAPYATRLGVHRTLQSEDGIFSRQHGSGSMLQLERLESRSESAGFLATVTLAVDPEATPAPAQRFGPGGPPPPGQRFPPR
jgi:protocatechuate 3,4-dioxygenase beta subunit